MSSGVCVELFGGRVLIADAVFLTADHTGLDLQDDFVLMAKLQHFNGEIHVLLERQLAGVEHVAVEQVRLARGTATGSLRNQGLQETVDFVRLAMIRVERDIDVVLCGYPVAVLCEGDRSKHHVLQIARGVGTAAGRDLDDTVALGLGENLRWRRSRCRWS